MKKKLQELKDILAKLPNRRNHLRKPHQISKNEFLNRIISFWIFLSILPLGKCQDFSNNLITNGNFTQPQVLNRTTFFSFSIPGWRCTQLCEIKNCTMGRQYWLPQHKVDSNCEGQVIDLNSNYFNQVVMQEIQLKAGLHLIHFNYYYPVLNSRSKMLQVTFNNKEILYVKPQIDLSFETFQFQAILQTQQGQNILSFSNLGYYQDGLGFKINNVSLYRINNAAIEDNLEIFIKGSSTINSIPSFRVLCRSVVSFFINFDRLQLYIYHDRIYSYYSQKLMLSVHQFISSHSNLADKILSYISSEAIQKQQNFIESIDLKSLYISYNSFSGSHKNGSYFQNFNQSFLYCLPFVIVIFILINQLFHLTYRVPFSLIFRKYSLWAIVLIMLFDGNIQSLTFMTFSELKIFFSGSFIHKAANVLILLIFFILLFITFAIFLWGKHYYSRNIRYLIDEQHSRLYVVWSIAIDRGVICFLFGSLHNLLIGTPDLQLFSLGSLEVLWIVKKIKFASNGAYDTKYLVYSSILSSFCRIFFQITCFFYEKNPNQRHYINQTLHFGLIYAIIVTSLMQFAVGTLCSVLGLIKICRFQSSKKVVDTFYHQAILKKHHPIQKLNLQKNEAKSGQVEILEQLKLKQQRKRFNLRRRENHLTAPRYQCIETRQKKTQKPPKRRHIQKIYV